MLERHLEGMIEKLRSGVSSKLREGIEQAINRIVVGMDGNVTFGTKLDGLLGLHSATP